MNEGPDSGRKASKQVEGRLKKPESGERAVCRHHVEPQRWQKETPETAQEADQGGQGRWGFKQKQRGAEETQGAEAKAAGKGPLAIGGIKESGKK